MASYPPPTPPPFPPQQDRYAARAQARAYKDQLQAQRRMARDQARFQARAYRDQRRALRRRSIVGPLILLTAGVLFLLAETGHVSWSLSFGWYERWWPAVLIFAGLIVLAEWLIDEHRRNNLPPGALVLPPRSIGSGLIFLLIVLALLGLSARGLESSLIWRGGHFGPRSDAGLNNRLNRLFGDRQDSYDTLSSPITASQGLVVRNPRGSVTVTGDSTDNQVHVSVHKQTYSWRHAFADRKDSELTPVFRSEANTLLLSVATVDGGQVDLTVQMPANAPLTVQADHGDVSISNLHAAVALSANHGDVDLGNITGAVNVHVNYDDASLTVHHITGDLVIEGRNGDVDLTDSTGTVTLRGDFFGNTHLQRVNGHLLFDTSRTHFEAVQVPGDFEVESKNLSATGLIGPVVLKTRDKDITLDRVQGAVQIVNRDGSVDVTHGPPLAPIEIANTHGSVDVGIPLNNGFELNADSRNGDVENDFNVGVQENGSAHAAHGTVGSGGVRIAITTTDGDVTVRKSSVAPPVPLAPPAPLAPLAPPASKAHMHHLRPPAPHQPTAVSTTF